MSFWDRLLPRDVIAFIITAGGLYLLLNGINGTVGACLLAVVAFYFGAEIFKEKVRVPNA